jgi:hypothetical protein
MEGTTGTRCRAAGQPVYYEVRELRDGEPPIDLGPRFRSGDFLEAADFVLDYLEENDPHREGLVSALEIVRVEGDARAVKTHYRHRDAVGRQAADLTAHWGFPVASWGRSRS